MKHLNAMQLKRERKAFEKWVLSRGYWSYAKCHNPLFIWSCQNKFVELQCDLWTNPLQLHDHWQGWLAKAKQGKNREWVSL